MRPNKHSLRCALEELSTPSGGFEVHTEVVTLTDDMAQGEEEEPTPEPPDGYTLGEKADTASDVVTWHELEPVEHE